MYWVAKIAPPVHLLRRVAITRLTPLRYYAAPLESVAQFKTGEPTMSFPSPFDQASFSLEDLLSSAPPVELPPLLEGPVQVNEPAGVSPTPTNHSDQAQLTLGTTPANQKKKKRVRREVRELKNLREQARELEVRLEQLKIRVPASGGLSSGRTCNTDVTAPSVWEKIAQRQLKERLHVEHIQDEPKAECTAHAKLVLDLVKRLKLCGKDARVCAMVRQKPARLWDLFSTDTDTAGIFAEQLTQVSKAYLKMQQQCLPRAKRCNPRRISLKEWRSEDQIPTSMQGLYSRCAAAPHHGPI